MQAKERVEFYKNQILLEEEIVESANASVKDVPNVMVKELILGIAMDSNKHASLLNALIALNTGSTPLIPEEITDQLKKNIAKHIELEQQAIDTYTALPSGQILSSWILAIARNFSPRDTTWLATLSMSASCGPQVVEQLMVQVSILPAGLAAYSPSRRLILQQESRGMQGFALRD